MPRRAKQGPEGDCARLGDPHKHNEQGERGAKKPRATNGTRYSTRTTLQARAPRDNRAQATTNDNGILEVLVAQLHVQDVPHHDNKKDRGYSVE